MVSKARNLTRKSKPPASNSKPLFDRLVVATHNAGKLREFQDLLKPYVRKIVSSGELKLPAPEETGTTFEENALIKAKAAAMDSGSLSLADDSGLCVAALGGKPGIYSARWAGEDRSFAVGMNRIQSELGDASDRSACFSCAVVLYWPDGTFKTIEGRVNGTIAREPRGANGHGYDPLFIPEGYDITFAEMDDETKNAISHRGKAIRSLVNEVFGKK